MIYIFDIDGTLADLSHRLHFIQQDPKDWRGFFAACTGDSSIEDIAYFARLLHDSGQSIILVSGRSDEVEEQTIEWLRQNFIPFKDIYMRKAGDYREDSIVKAELLDQLLEDWMEDGKPAVVFEDRQRVVDMYRARGLRVFQVAPGNF